MRTLGVIGGSGLYEMDGLSDVKEHPLETPFGEPSDAVIEGTLTQNGHTARLLFLPRHGRGHRFPPHRINYRANLWALKKLGAEQVVSFSAVGSMKERIEPGDLVLVDQYVDRTRHRVNTFFDDDGVAAHVEFAEPIDGALREALHRAAMDVGAKVHNGGTYVCIDGPQFSTRAESLLFRSWGVDVIGMTNLPEARLAREAELPYASVALATDYDCWHQSEESVTVEAVIAVLKANTEKARRVVRRVAELLPDPLVSPATSALRHAVMTDPSKISPEAKQKLSLLIEKYLG
ncbi:MAG: S-methyl-5'-thioadenosine phosphorylase [Myxococcota bacterium]